MNAIEDRNDKIVIYETSDGQTQLAVKLEKETVWLTQQQMATLFDTSRTNVVEHIKHIYEEGELKAESTCRNFRQVREEGSRTVTRNIPYYNLDMIISLGYRVKSITATRFRQWANRILKEYLVNGYAVNERIRKEQINELRQLVQILIVQKHKITIFPILCFVLA